MPEWRRCLGLLLMAPFGVCCCAWLAGLLLGDWRALVPLGAVALAMAGAWVLSEED